MKTFFQIFCKADSQFLDGSTDIELTIMCSATLKYSNVLSGFHEQNHNFYTRKLVNLGP